MICRLLDTTGVPYVLQPFHQGRFCGTNVIVRHPGVSRKAIVLAAHYDGPGAYDNASGVAVLLAFAHLLGRARQRHPVYVCFLDREEQGQAGAMAVLREHARTRGRKRSGIRETVALAVVVDGCGLGRDCVAIEGGSAWDLRVGGKLLKIRVAADSARFAAAGIPCLHCCSLPAREARQLLLNRCIPSSWRHLHALTDRPSLLSGRMLRNNLSWLVRLVRNAARHEVPRADPALACSVVSEGSENV